MDELAEGVLTVEELAEQEHHFGGDERLQLSDLGREYFLGAGAVINGGKGRPVRPQRGLVQVENTVSALSADEIGGIVHYAQVPLRDTVGKVAHVNPEVAAPIGDDVADVQVAVQTGGRGGHGVEETVDALLVGIGQVLVPVHRATHQLAHVWQPRCIGRGLVYLLSEHGEAFRQWHQLVGLLRDDAGE